MMGFDISKFRKNNPSEWLEWLSDDPLPSKQQTASPVPQAQPRVHSAPSYGAAPYAPAVRPAIRPDVVAPVVGPVAQQVRPVGPPGMSQPIQSAVPKVVAPAVAPQKLAQGVKSIRPMARHPRPVESFWPGKANATPSVMSLSSRIQTTATQAVPAVSIQINMPKLNMPKLPQMPALPYGRIGIVAGCVSLIVGLSIGGYRLYKHFSVTDRVAVKGTSVSATPTFDPLAPQDKPQLGQGNGAAENTAYDKDRGLYAFKDNLMGFGVTVSQQALPENLKKSPGDLKKVAESMGGDQAEVETAFGKAYISTAAKNEAQRVVFIYQDKMVFMNSYKRFDNDTWKYYIETLR